MARSRLLCLVAGAPFVAGVAVATWVQEAAGWPEFLFGSVLLLSLVSAVDLAGHARRSARAEQLRERRLAATTLDDVARSAVVGERTRLATDIEAVVRTAAADMGRAAEDAVGRWDADPAPALRAVQEHGQRAGLELRRLLGLLRNADDEATAPPPDTTGPAWPSRSDLLAGVLVTCLAVGEHLVWSRLGGLPVHPVAVVLTAAAGATVTLRRSAPGLGGALCGLVFTAGLWAPPPEPGLWIVATVGSLTWTALARREPRDVVGVLVLAGGVLLESAVRLPENVPITVLVLAVAATGGLVVGWSTARGAAARSRADGRAAALGAAAEEAARRARLAVARELHDVVSHAVGVMVVQAGAALALRGTDPAGARRAVDVVRRTAVETLGELDRLVEVIGQGALGVPVGPPLHGGDDLDGLLERMRAAGLSVRCRTKGVVEGVAVATVYRIVQETLTNALRHAPQANVTVHVDSTRGGTSVQVEDDGPGPDASSRRGYGLVGIAERVHSLGGEFTAGPGPGGVGFRVSVRLPAVHEQAA
jgi:signal transduction histidine kinase